MAKFVEKVPVDIRERNVYIVHYEKSHKGA